MCNYEALALKAVISAIILFILSSRGFMSPKTKYAATYFSFNESRFAMLYVT